MESPENAALLQAATRSFDHLIYNEVTGTAVCAFLEAVFSMEVRLFFHLTLFTLVYAGPTKAVLRLLFLLLLFSVSPDSCVDPIHDRSHSLHHAV